ncbi:DNA repair protein [Burkholderia vietnamiensis]|uniref:DNA repair protein n=1 Tax=Burkholderia vietnamiensis TaxID=60552 RepID=UPI001D13DEE0|nr:DNA repair protein [Burkholderia vietnamiensis]UEC01687.1 DNA repair protein [Burkholderia vietnamiensis]
MQLLSLTLKGFRGIRDGLGLDTLTLDFEALCDGAVLVAIVGANGRGKSTVLDNMHPYLTMPSRAGAAGVGSFSYYDHVFLPESEKDLVWALDGRSYRSQVVIRLNGRRRTEAFLFKLSDAGAWRPVVLDDGTVSDGKVETYTRCVERLCGSADTFFTSVFGAQGKRHLSDYRNAEIKTLLADLLGQEAIRELGRRAGDTAKLLKAGLVAVRQELVQMDTEGDRLAREVQAGADAPARVEQTEAALRQAAATLEDARAACVRITAQRERCRADDARRAQLHAEREAVRTAARATSQELDTQERTERQRLDRLDQRIAQQKTQAGQRRERLQGIQGQCLALLAREPAVQRAARRLPLAERLLGLRTDRLAACRRDAAAWEQAQATLRLLAQRVQGIEREAGQAALQAQSLARRFGLTAEVPCSGTPLQGRCQLLGDAREAQALIPSAQAMLQRLSSEKGEVEREIQEVHARAQALASAARRLAEAQRLLDRGRERASRCALLGGKIDEMRSARQRLADSQAELAAMASDDEGGGMSQVDREERDAIDAGLRGIDERRGRQSTQLVQALARLDAVLATLPPPFEAGALADAEAFRERALASHAAVLRSQQEAQRQVQVFAVAREQQAQLTDRRAAAARRSARIESAVGDWTLLARCMSNDGLIALAIDDAGPALSALANELLLASYGPRFTVSILTQAETAKGEKREDFDIVVHDTESDESKSVRLMSGGERVWINECLVRAVALYLAQASERRYGTLFSDEADGALDPARKRMFGAMKREVLRLGGYQREFFISQTPELAGMADVVIDLEELKADSLAALPVVHGD